jgi:hypothetical protein
VIVDLFKLQGQSDYLIVQVAWMRGLNDNGRDIHGCSRENRIIQGGKQKKEPKRDAIQSNSEI